MQNANLLNLLEINKTALENMIIEKIIQFLSESKIKLGEIIFIYIYDIYTSLYHFYND